jgi:hypothetical protein
MRIWMLAWLMLLPSLLFSQDSLYFTRTGHIYFISHTEIIDIDAHNRQVGSFLNVKTGELAFNLLMKSFEFTLPLAEEHFNENYVESEKYPRSTFKGKILNHSDIDWSAEATVVVKVEGSLEMHGVTKPIKADGELDIGKGVIRARSEFVIALDDYKIKVPSIVADRVAPLIPIKVEMVYHPYVAGVKR